MTSKTIHGYHFSDVIIAFNIDGVSCLVYLYCVKLCRQAQQCILQILFTYMKV